MRKTGTRPSSGLKERENRNKDLDSKYNTTASGTKRKSILDQDGKLNESYVSSKTSPITGNKIYRKSTVVFEENPEKEDTGRGKTAPAQKMTKTYGSSADKSMRPSVMNLKM